MRCPSLYPLLLPRPMVQSRRHSMSVDGIIVICTIAQNSRRADLSRAARARGVEAIRTSLIPLFRDGGQDAIVLQDVDIVGFLAAMGLLITRIGLAVMF